MSVNTALNYSSREAGDVAQKELISDEEKQAVLAAILNSSDDAIISMTLNGCITSWNSAAMSIFGYTKQEMVGRNISLIIPPEKLAEDATIMQSVYAGNNIDHFETIGIASDGSEKMLSVSISPIKNNKGVIVGASRVARDISFKKVADEKQAVLAAIVESSDDAIISKTLEGIITSWNKAATKMFGYEEKEVLGRHISIIIPPARINEETHIIENIRAGRKIDHFETVRVTKDGRERPISLTVSPVKDASGRITGASKVARDISAKLEAEKQQAIYTQKLKDLNKYKDEFMVMASHELKTPLTVILANLQILQSKLPGDEHKRFLNTSIKQVLKLSGLVSDLLDVSKIQVGKLVLNKTDFDLTALLEETKGYLRQTSENHQIIFREEAAERIINADRDRIEQVLINLISNAIKYMPAGGNIYIGIESDADNVIVSVADSGIGIPEKDLENIFQRYYRVSGPANSFSGSGVGLFISAEVIKAHKGKIWAESILHKGSVFYFSLPVLS